MFLTLPSQHRATCRKGNKKASLTTLTITSRGLTSTFGAIMTSISATTSSTFTSPLQKLQDQLQAEVNSGAVSSSDQSALSSALNDINSSLQSGSASDSSGGSNSSPGALKSKIDGLIANGVSSGKLTSHKATELQRRFNAAFANVASRPPAAGGTHHRHPPPPPHPTPRRHRAQFPAVAAEFAVAPFTDLVGLKRHPPYRRRQQFVVPGASDQLSKLTPRPGGRRRRHEPAAAGSAIPHRGNPARLEWNRAAADALVPSHQPKKGRVMMMTDVMTKPHQLIASDRVEGTAVRRPNGERIGHIERLMIDKISGKVSYAILSFGGFLGIGTNLLPLPWGRLKYNPRFEAYELDIDDEELRRAPSFRADKDFDWGDRSQEAELHRYYGIPPYWGGF